MNKLIGPFNRIISAVKGVSIPLRDKFKYETEYGYDDFDLDELINKRALAGKFIKKVTVVSVLGTDPQTYDYDYGTDVSAATTILVFAEQVYSDPDLAEDVLIHYTCNYKKIPSTNHIKLIRGDAGDIVNYTLVEY